MDRELLEKFAYDKDDLKLITSKKKKGLQKITTILKDGRLTNDKRSI